MSVKPITPEEAKKSIIKSFPDYIIESVNELIVENRRGVGSITILREDVIKRIQSKKDVSRGYLFDNKFLDFEEIYKDQGWHVNYDQPCQGEDFKAYYQFTPNNNV